jgi:hypothetical protein
MLEFNFDQYGKEGNEGANLEKLEYVFKFKDEVDLAKVKDYFEQYPKEERGEELARLIL